MRTKKTTCAPSAPPRLVLDESQIPWWVDDTTAEHTYKLIVFENGDYGKDENIDVSRAEFIALKKHLAAMRGYRVGDVATESAVVAEMHKLPESYKRARDAQQSARHLQTAREIYRHCPDLVVFESEAFDQNVASLAD